MDANLRKVFAKDIENKKPLTCIADMLQCKCRLTSDCMRPGWLLRRASFMLKDDHEGVSRKFFVDLIKSVPRTDGRYIVKSLDDMRKIGGAAWVIYILAHVVNVGIEHIKADDVATLAAIELTVVES